MSGITLMMFERNAAIVPQKKPSDCFLRTAAGLPDPGTFSYSTSTSGCFRWDTHPAVVMSWYQVIKC